MKKPREPNLRVCNIQFHCTPQHVRTKRTIWKSSSDLRPAAGLWKDLKHAVCVHEPSRTAPKHQQMLLKSIHSTRFWMKTEKSWLFKDSGEENCKINICLSVFFIISLINYNFKFTPELRSKRKKSSLLCNHQVNILCCTAVKLCCYSAFLLHC